tara:strand:+ start:1065 stop:1226 length:162 start_codon:yes stop_codon:yes gene_type:complete
MIIYISYLNVYLKKMKKLEIIAVRLYKLMARSVYLAPFMLGAYGFLNLVQWTS